MLQGLADTMPSMVDVAPSRIVIFLPNWVGDAVMFTPTLRAIRRQFADSELALVARPGPAAVLSPNPWTENIILHRGGLLALAWKLRRGRYDLAVLGPNSFRSALAARLGQATKILGYDRDGRGFLLTDGLAAPRSGDGGLAVTPALEYYLKLAERLGCEVGDRRMELAVSEEDASAAGRLLAEAGADPARPIVLLNPGASYGPSKLYPAGRYGAVADALIERRGAQIVINAAPEERPVARAVESAMKCPPLVNLAAHDNSLGLVKAIAGRCDLAITNDTGARHIAAAMGAAVVTIFGATDPGWTTIQYDRERIVRVDVPCGPCQRKRCPLPPGPEHHQCMLAIPPARVVEAAEELLEASRPRAERRR